MDPAVHPSTAFVLRWNSARASASIAAIVRAFLAAVAAGSGVAAAAATARVVMEFPEITLLFPECLRDASVFGTNLEPLMVSHNHNMSVF
jgi:hypothetical protein|eukprot:6629112-Prymnesium_polylepis.1